MKFRGLRISIGFKVWMSQGMDSRVKDKLLYLIHPITKKEAHVR